MAGIFEQTKINGMALRNRLVRSATWEGMCEPDGRPTEKLINCYRDLAIGGIGLIITGYTFVRPDGKQFPGKMGLHTDDFEKEMKAMTAAVHEAGGAICLQLVHCGGQTTTEMAGRQPLAPSAITADQFNEPTAELSKDDIKDIVSAFGAAAARAKQYGFDAVQLHAAHGYLINQFLSPLLNKRTDEYGGTAQNRCRFLMEVYKSVRDTVGADYPVLVKLNGADNLPGGLTTEDALVAAKLLDEAKVDAIEISGGTPASGDESPVRVKIKKPDGEAYNLALAQKIKEAVSCPIMSVGGYRSLDVIEKAIAGGIDYVSLARPLIREPGLALRWQGGDTAAAKCISCNACFMLGLKEGGIACAVEKKLKEAANSRN